MGGRAKAARLLVVFLASLVAVHPPLKLWVPWTCESFVASIIGRPWGWRQHPWQPLAEAPVPPTPVNTINATELAAGATVDLTRPLLVRGAATAEALELYSVEALQRPREVNCRTIRKRCRIDGRHGHRRHRCVRERLPLMLAPAPWPPDDRCYE